MTFHCNQTETNNCSNLFIITLFFQLVHFVSLLLSKIITLPYSHQLSFQVMTVLKILFLFYHPASSSVVQRVDCAISWITGGTNYLCRTVSYLVLRDIPTSEPWGPEDIIIIIIIIIIVIIIILIILSFLLIGLHVFILNVLDILISFF